MNRVGELNKKRDPEPELFEQPPQRQSKPTGLRYRRVSPPLSVAIEDAK